MTAYSKEDALALLNEAIAPGHLPGVADIIEDVRLDQLDQGHVVPNMHPIVERGVWYPMMRTFS